MVDENYEFKDNDRLICITMAALLDFWGDRLLYFILEGSDAFVPFFLHRLFK